MASDAAPASAVPTDEDVRAELAVLLKSADLSVTTEKMLRKQLEEKLGCDLTDRKQLVRDEVQAYLAQLQPEGDEAPADEPAAAEEEPEEEEEEEAPKKKAKPPRKKSGGGGGGGGGRSAQLGSVLSPEMQAFLGVESMSRPQVVKAMWEYIRSNNLQDPSNKRNILLDDKLGTIFKQPINIFSMNKQLSCHCAKAGQVPVGFSGIDAVLAATKGKKKKRGSDDGDGDDDYAESGPSRKKGKGGGGGGGGGWQRPVQVSEGLAELLGTGGKPIARSEITKRMWAYFKSNNLIDPSNKKMVLCDERLRKLTGVDKFAAFGHAKFLAPHIGKAAAQEDDDEEDEDEEEDDDEDGDASG